MSCTLHYLTPPYWTTHIEESDRCPDISGTYHNSGETVGGSSTAYLYDELTEAVSFITSKCKTCLVDIHWLDDQNQTLIVTIKTDRGSFRNHLQQVEGDFSCDSGLLTINYKIVAEYIIEGTWITGTRIFKRRKDGSIVRKDQHSAYGHWLIIPLGFKDVIEYAQWLPVEQVTNNSADNLSDD